MVVLKEFHDVIDESINIIQKVIFRFRNFGLIIESRIQDRLLESLQFEDSCS